MDNPWIYILIVIAAAVAVPVIVHAIRMKDYKDQVSGKKPEREIKSRHYYTDEKEKPNSERERLKREAEQKSKDNQAGLFF